MSFITRAKQKYSFKKFLKFWKIPLNAILKDSVLVKLQKIKKN